MTLKIIMNVKNASSYDETKKKLKIHLIIINNLSCQEIVCVIAKVPPNKNKSFNKRMICVCVCVQKMAIMMIENKETLDINLGFFQLFFNKRTNEITHTFCEDFFCCIILFQKLTFLIIVVIGLFV